MTATELGCRGTTDGGRQDAAGSRGDLVTVACLLAAFLVSLITVLAPLFDRLRP